MELRAALTDNDVTWLDMRAAIVFNAEVLWIGRSAVPGDATSFARGPALQYS